MRTVLAVLVALAGFVLPAVAEPERPIALQGRSDASYEGLLGGLHVWRIDGDPRIWALAPDGVTLLLGDVMGPAAQRSMASAAPPGQPSAPSRPASGGPLDPVADLQAAGVDLEAVAEQLDAAPTEVKAALLAALVEALKAAETREAYLEAVATWRESVLAQLDPSSAAARPDVSGVNAPQAQTSSGPAQAADAALDTIPDLDARSGALLEQARRSGLWFGLGRAGAPTVYALMDPTCPYCAKAMEALDPRLRAGEIDLRILLAPVLSERAVDLSATLLLAPDPSAAFLEHELRVARTGRSALEARSFSELPDHLADGLRTNHGIVVDNDIPGVPFFLFDTLEGPRWTFGVPTAETFARALADPFLGDVPPAPEGGTLRPGG